MNAAGFLTVSVRVTWTQAPQCQVSRPGDQDSCGVTWANHTHGVDTMDKGVVPSRAGHSGTTWDFIMLLRTAHNLNTYYFWNFPLNIFRPRWPQVAETAGNKQLQCCFLNWAPWKLLSQQPVPHTQEVFHNHLQRGKSQGTLPACGAPTAGTTVPSVPSGPQNCSLPLQAAFKNLTCTPGSGASVLLPAPRLLPPEAFIRRHFACFSKYVRPFFWRTVPLETRSALKTAAPS